MTPYAVSPPKGLPGTHGRRFWLAAPSDAPAPIDSIAGPVELVVANRRAATARAVLELRLVAIRRPRKLRVRLGGGRTRQVRLQPERPRRVSLPITVSSRSTAIVSLDPGRPSSRPDGTLAPLVGLTRVELR